MPNILCGVACFRFVFVFFEAITWGILGGSFFTKGSEALSTKPYLSLAYCLVVVLSIHLVVIFLRCLSFRMQCCKCNADDDACCGLAHCLCPGCRVTYDCTVDLERNSFQSSNENQEPQHPLVSPILFGIECGLTIVGLSASVIHVMTKSHTLSLAIAELCLLCFWFLLFMCKPLALCFSLGPVLAGGIRTTG